MINFNNAKITDITVSDYKEFEEFLKETEIKSGGNLSANAMASRVYLLGGRSENIDFAELIMSDKFMDPEFRVYLGKSCNRYDDGSFKIFEFLYEKIFMFSNFRKYDFFDYNRIRDLIIKEVTTLISDNPGTRLKITDNPPNLSLGSSSFISVCIELFKYIKISTLPIMQSIDATDTEAMEKYFNPVRIRNNGEDHHTEYYTPKKEFIVYMVTSILYNSGFINIVNTDKDCMASILKSFYKYEDDINNFVNVFSELLNENELASALPKMFFNENIPVAEREEVLKKHYKVKNLFRYTDNLRRCSFDTFEAFMNVTIFKNNRLKDKNITIAELVYRVFFNVRDKELFTIGAEANQVVEKYYMEIFDGMFEHTQNLNVSEKFSLDIVELQLVKSQLFKALKDKPCFRKDHLTTFYNYNQLISEIFFSAYNMSLEQSFDNSVLKNIFATYYYGKDDIDSADVSYDDVVECFNIIANAAKYNKSCYSMGSNLNNLLQLWKLTSALLEDREDDIKNLFNVYIDYITTSENALSYFDTTAQATYNFDATKYVDETNLSKVCNLWFVLYKLAEKFPGRFEFENTFDTFINNFIVATFEAQQKDMEYYKSNNCFTNTSRYMSVPNFHTPFYFLMTQSPIGPGFNHIYLNLGDEYMDFVINTVLKKICTKMYDGIYNTTNIIMPISEGIMELASIQSLISKSNVYPSELNNAINNIKNTITSNISLIRNWSLKTATIVKGNKEFEELYNSIEANKDMLEESISKYITEPLEFLYNLKA